MLFFQRFNVAFSVFFDEFARLDWGGPPPPPAPQSNDWSFSAADNWYVPPYEPSEAELQHDQVFDHHQMLAHGILNAAADEIERLASLGQWPLRSEDLR